MVRSGKKKKKLSQQIYDDMLHEISSGRWKPGDRIPSEKELIARYSVSRITVREAVQQLISLGLLRAKQGSGTFVCEYSEEMFAASLNRTLLLFPRTKQDILNMLRVRMLEIVIAGQAAECSTPASVAVLKKIHRRMQASPDNIEVHVETDTQFHLQICRMTGNQLLLELCMKLYEGLEAIMPSLSRLMGGSHAIEYHGILIDTIEKHYVSETRHVMERHLLDTIEAVEREPEDSDIFS